MTLAKFRERYPQGSLVSKLIQIDRGIYIVKASIKIGNTTLMTAMAGAGTIEAAEDAARERAIAALVIDSLPQSPSVQVPKNKLTSDISSLDSTFTPELELIKSQLIPPSPLKIVVDAAETENKNVVNKNIVNFSQPTVAKTIPADDLTPKTAPTPIVESPLAEALSEPEIEEPKSVDNSYNLFEGTLSSEALGTLGESPASKSNSNISSVSITSDHGRASVDTASIDFNEIKQKTDIEIKRLGWTKDDGREFLKSRYGKRSRLHLTDEQLLEFLRYLEKEPTLVK